MKFYEITMFFPAYNEEENIATVIESATRVLATMAKKYEILVIVYEGSTDNTRQIVKDITKSDPHVRLIIQPKEERGINRANIIGFQNAQYPLIFYADADNQFRIEEFITFLPFIEKYDIIAGYRRKRHDPLARVITSKIYNFLVRQLFSIPYRDVDCSFRLVKKHVFNSIKLSANTGVGTSELLAKAHNEGFKILQIPVNHYPRTKGKSVFETRNLNIPRLSVVKEIIGELRQVRQQMRKNKQ